VAEIHRENTLSVRRLSSAFEEPVSTVGRWIQMRSRVYAEQRRRACPVSGDHEVRYVIRSLCQEDRHLTWGYRRIRVLCNRRYGLCLNHKTVHRVMREEGLGRPRVWHRPLRPRRVEKMLPTGRCQSWQVDMTSFQLSCLTTLFLVVVIDCFSRRIVGWTVSRRCRASEWVAAVRMGLEAEGLFTKEHCAGLTLRSDNGPQPCSKKFVEYLGKCGIKGQYTGYDAPDDNAYVERVIRTIKEEEVWLNSYETFLEAHEAIERYVDYYNQERIHSALDYRTPNEYAAPSVTLKAA
jgi:putative transposase